MKVAWVLEDHQQRSGLQYTSNLYNERIRAESESISISMDGRGRCMDNIFTEIFWRSYKQEEVYLKEYESPHGPPLDGGA
ncbi:hypothetical protein MASR2M79_10770 [Aminivibrio sp.]